ncbi:GNAT family N-acetyltransferase [Edaphobacter aggregans]|nr:GNAT family N-acetyltransferase [Edaphobacter aggregans]
MTLTFALADIPSDESASLSMESIELRAYQPEDAKAFRELNEAWIKKYFGLEEHDREILGDPDSWVIRPGGHIFLAFLEGQAIGCCALIPMEPGVFEVAKMAVDEQYRGRGVGRKVLAYTIERARELGASVLYLETNRKLANAIHLYESLGFQHLPPKESPYVRANVFMELRLGTTADLRG